MRRLFRHGAATKPAELQLELRGSDARGGEATCAKRQGELEASVEVGFGDWGVGLFGGVV